MDYLSVLSLLFVEPLHELSIKLLRSDHLIPLSKKRLSARLHRRAIIKMRRIGPWRNLSGGFWSEMRLETSVSCTISGRTRILVCLRLFWFLPRLRLFLRVLLSGLPLRFLATRFALDNHFIIVRRQKTRIVSSSFASFRLGRGSLFFRAPVTTGLLLCCSFLCIASAIRLLRRVKFVFRLSLLITGVVQQVDALILCLHWVTCRSRILMLRFSGTWHPLRQDIPADRNSRASGQVKHLALFQIPDEPCFEHL